ncbi:MAG: 4a-hydroxytetrahydrobiopterin dehydratase [Roseiflexaceae bacterium]
MQILNHEQITSELVSLTGWSLAGQVIERTIECASFPAAIALVTQIGFAAEATAHHPDIDIRWRRVRLALATHDAGGITEKDIALAHQINDLLG